jgi:hypothetical protein
VSTIKADAITAVSTNADLSLDGLGTGGVSIASTLKMTKGGDISSASPLVIDTDGNYFDVTGTTSFSAMTVEAGNFFMLQFDGVLTITHGSGIELPGAANMTTATGDRLICYATAANTVEVMSMEKEAAASAGGFTLATEQATTSGTVITFGSIPADMTTIVINFNSVSSSSRFYLMLTLGDSGGLETSSYVGGRMFFGNGGGTASVAGETDKFRLTSDTATTDEWTGSIILTLQDASNNHWMINGNLSNATNNEFSVVAGSKPLSGELTQLAITVTAGAYDSGSLNIMYQ